MNADAEDVERRLSLSYAPASARSALEVLWTLDAAFAGAVRAGGGAMVRQIRLVWWRDAVAALDAAPAPAEPLLRAIQAELLPRGVSGAELAALEEPWSVLLEDAQLADEELDGYARRGGLLFGWAARLLGGEPADAVDRAGEGWALVDLARHSSREDEARAALAAARERVAGGYRWPKRLRPIGVLAAMAERDALRGEVPPEPQGSPARLLRMLRLRLTGR